MEWWTRAVEWNGGMERNADKLDGFNGFSPLYNDHLLTKTILNKDQPNLIAK